MLRKAIELVGSKLGDVLDADGNDIENINQSRFIGNTGIYNQIGVGNKNFYDEVDYVEELGMNNQTQLLDNSAGRDGGMILVYGQNTSARFKNFVDVVLVAYNDSTVVAQHNYSDTTKSDMCERTYTSGGSNGFYITLSNSTDKFDVFARSHGLQ